MGRPRVVSLAFRTLGRLLGRTPGGSPGLAHSGRVVSLVPNDGAVLVDTERGPILLLLAWEARIEGPRGQLDFKDIRTGDVVEWTHGGGRSVAMVQDVRVVREDAR